MALQRRVGARQKNFRRYVIEGDVVYKGMRREKATITIASDFSIKCSLPKGEKSEVDLESIEPTKVEIEAIRMELANAVWLNPIDATKALVDELQNLLGCEDNHFFAFKDRGGGSYPFVQQRVFDEAGEKSDYPWTFWSDGKWRSMEPGDLLPLYGLDQLKTGKPVMIHEGPKNAKKVQAMCDDESTEGKAKLRAHPWGEDLKDYAHIGWPGGADNPHRVDWSPIKKMSKHARVVLTCDCDQAGEKAAGKISSILRRNMSVIRFDSRFPAGHDLGDDWPKKLTDRNGRYTGPSFGDCLQSATWATDVIPNPSGKGRSLIKIRDEFAEEWWFSSDPPGFVHRSQPDRLLDDKTFNREVRPFSNAEDTARLMIEVFSSKCNSVGYNPGLPGGVIDREGQRIINSYRPSRIKAIKCKMIKCKPFLKFMRHLVPEKGDREKALKWIATLIARGDIRMTYAMLLISEAQGVGKGTLGESILAPLVGNHNVSFPGEQEVTESQFNYWLAQKRLAVVHEIYAGHSSKAYNKLKSVITDKFVTVNKKNVPTYDVENWIHVFACSNSKRALYLDDTDRRWLVPRVTELTKDPSYWRELHRWLQDDGLGIIMTWAEKYVAKHGPVLSGEHAPSTILKKELIEEGRSQGQQLAYDLGVQALNLAKSEPPVKVVLVVEEVRKWIAGQRHIELSHPHLEKPATILKMLREAGLQVPVQRKGEKMTRFTTGNGQKSYVAANFHIDSNAGWPELKVHYHHPESNVLWPLF